MKEIPSLKTDIIIFPEENQKDKKYIIQIQERFFQVNYQIYKLILILQQKPKDFNELVVIYCSQNNLPQNDIAEKHIQKLLEMLPRDFFSDTIVLPNKEPFLIKFNILSNKSTLSTANLLKILYDPKVSYIAIFFILTTQITLTLLSFTATQQSLSKQEYAFIIAVLIVTSLIHEIGHITACHHYKCSYGNIGIGLYWFFPVFYADVTKSWQLPSEKRLIVDCGGIYFQSIIISLITSIVFPYNRTFSVALTCINNLLILQNLNPFLKLDGYWILSDFFNIKNLHQKVTNTLKEIVRFKLPKSQDNTAKKLLYAMYIYIFLGLIYFTYFTYLIYIQVQKAYTVWPQELLTQINYLKNFYVKTNTVYDKSMLVGILHLFTISIIPVLLFIVVTILVLKITSFLYNLLFLNKQKQPS